MGETKYHSNLLKASNFFAWTENLRPNELAQHYRETGVEPGKVGELYQKLNSSLKKAQEKAITSRKAAILKKVRSRTKTE